MNGEDPFLVVDLRLRYAVCQACCYRKQRGQEPQPPPKGTLLSPHQLVPAETAVAVEWAGDAAAARALVELKAAVGAASLLGVVEDHRRLVAARAQARRDKRQRRELHISVITGITIGRRRVCL